MASGTMIYQGQAGHTYTFLALATDVAGNHELPPARANVPQNTTTREPGRTAHRSQHDAAQLRHSAGARPSSPRPTRCSRKRSKACRPRRRRATRRNS